MKELPVIIWLPVLKFSVSSRYRNIKAYENINSFVYLLISTNAAVVLWVWGFTTFRCHQYFVRQVGIKEIYLPLRHRISLDIGLWSIWDSTTYIFTCVPSAGDATIRDTLIASLLVSSLPLWLEAQSSTVISVLIIRSKHFSWYRIMVGPLI